MDLNSLDKKVRTYADDNKINGVLRITVKDRVVYEAKLGWADIASKKEFDKNSMFTFYSLSKPFCVMGFLRLVEQGLVDLDSHPGRYLPEAEKFDPRVTLRQMLCHVSGLPDFGENSEFFTEGEFPPSDHRRVRADIARIHELPLHFEPGTGSWYANINIGVPALIIEEITGREYGEYMAKEVFAPLGMEHAMVDRPDLAIPERVTGYGIDENGEVFPQERTLDWMVGGGDIIGTVDDVYRLNHAIKERLILSPETWEMALTPNPISQMGMGCTVIDWHGKRRIHHNGGHLGFRTYHFQIPADDFDLILMSNSGFGNARNDLAEIVHDEVYGTDENSVRLDPELDRGFI